MLESWVQEQLDELGMARGGVSIRLACKRGNGDLIDQMAQKRRLRQQLDVDEVGRRLQRDRLELLAPMQPTG
jgi:hypothetical protein